MTRERFIAIQTRRGYEIEELGLMVILHSVTEEGHLYTAIWFFNEDDTLDETQRPQWSIKRP